MFDALLATIGTLGVLASLLAKRGNARADAGLDEPAGQDRPRDLRPAAPARRGACRQRRVRLVRGTGR